MAQPGRFRDGRTAKPTGFVRIVPPAEAPRSQAARDREAREWINRISREQRIWDLRARGFFGMGGVRHTTRGVGLGRPREARAANRQGYGALNSRPSRARLATRGVMARSASVPRRWRNP